MIVAIDTNCILPGQVGGIENYTLGLIESLKLPASPASQLLLLTRPENQFLFEKFVDAKTKTLLIDRPHHHGKQVENWLTLLAAQPIEGHRTLTKYQQHKSMLLLQHNVDLLHCPGNTINPLDTPLPVVLNLHDLQHRHFPEYFTAEELQNRDQWWNASAQRADALVAASNYVRNDLHEQLGINPHKIFVTPDPFESAYLKPPAQNQLNQLRDRLQLPSQFFIYPAACWPHKNHARLIRAFVDAKLPGAQLILTGGGQSQPDLPALIASLSAESNVRLLGRVTTEDLVGLYHLATALIFPSQHESWSIPIMEAMATGCPVACSNVTSLPEEIGNAGLLFSPEDQGEITRTILKLATDDALRATFSARGKKRVRLFNTDQFLKTISAAYSHARSTFHKRKAA